MTQGLLYQNIANSIKQDILSGKYPVGSYLLTEVQLEKLYNVSKVTIRQAVQILADEGYVVKKSGKGTRIVSNRLFNKLSKAVSYSTILEKDHTLEKELVKFETVHLDKGDAAYESLGSIAHRLTRIYNLDGVPFIYFEHYFPHASINEDKALQEIKENSIYKWLSIHGYEVAGFSDSFDVIEAKEEVKKILNLKDSHILLRTRKSYDASGNVVELSYGHYNSKVKPYIVEYEI